MIRSRIFQKLYAGYVLIILFCTAIVSLMIARQMQQDGLVEIENSLNSQAIIIRESILPALASGQIDDLQQRIIQITQGINSRITIIAKDGRVLADSQQDPVTMDNHRDRPELQQAVETGLGVVTRFSDTLSKSMRYMAMPIDAAHHHYGFIRVALPLSQIDQRLNRLRNIVIVSASLTAVIALLLGFWIARSFAVPLSRMKNMAQLFSEGDYKQRLVIDRQDEMGELAKTLNLFAETAEQREATRRDFIANASHELKTPVTAIQGITETLIEDASMDEETRQHFLQKVNGQSIRLSQLISDLLALSRLESSGTESFENIDLKEIIEDNKIAIKVHLRRKMELSDNATLIIALYKLVANEEEREILADNRTIKLEDMPEIKISVKE